MTQPASRWMALGILLRRVVQEGLGLGLGIGLGLGLGLGFRDGWL